MKKFFVSLLLLLLTPAARADSLGPGGIAFGLAAEYGASSLRNPDKTKADYDTFGFAATVNLPLIGSSGERFFGLDLKTSLRYLDLENTADGPQSEIAKIIAPGLGVQLRFGKVIAGADYEYGFVHHYVVGPMSSELEYKMPLLTYYGGILIPFKQVNIGLVYSNSSGKAPGEKTGLSEDSPFTEHSVMLRFTYSSGISLFRFVDQVL